MKVWNKNGLESGLPNLLNCRETPDFWTFLLTENLLISGADFQDFLLVSPDL